MEDRNAPATKGDLADANALLKAELKADIAEVRTELKADIADVRTELKADIAQLRAETNHQYRDLVERISDSETRLLKAFYDFAQSNQKRMTEIEGNEAAIRSRLATIEDRLLNVEKRLNMPPAA